jgi:hypothetical protein
MRVAHQQSSTTNNSSLKTRYEKVAEKFNITEMPTYHMVRNGQLSSPRSNSSKSDLSDDLHLDEDSDEGEKRKKKMARMQHVIDSRLQEESDVEDPGDLTTPIGHNHRPTELAGIFGSEDTDMRVAHRLEALLNKTNASNTPDEHFQEHSLETRSLMLVNNSTALNISEMPTYDMVRIGRISGSCSPINSDQNPDDDDERTTREFDPIEESEDDRTPRTPFEMDVDEESLDGGVTPAAVNLSGEEDEEKDAEDDDEDDVLDLIPTVPPPSVAVAESAAPVQITAAVSSTTIEQMSEMVANYLRKNMFRDDQISEPAVSMTDDIAPSEYNSL